MQSPESRENVLLDPEVSWKYSLKTELAGEVFSWSLRIFLRERDFALCITLCHIHNIIQISLRVQVPGNTF